MDQMPVTWRTTSSRLDVPDSNSVHLTSEKNDSSDALEDVAQDDLEKETTIDQDYSINDCHEQFETTHFEFGNSVNDYPENINVSIDPIFVEANFEAIQDAVAPSEEPFRKKARRPALLDVLVNIKSGWYLSKSYNIAIRKLVFLAYH